MNSSTGFKKRLLRPASGLLNKQKQFLRVFDISQSQLLVSASLRSQMAKIQEEINLLDKDKMIRMGQSSLQRPYINTLKKELRQLQRQSDKEEDDVRVLKQMGVQSYEGGFKKLWRLFCLLDTMIAKITQLQMVQFIQYDEMYSEIAKDSKQTAAILSAMANNRYQYSSFPLTQVILSRDRDVFEISRKKSYEKGNNHQLVGMLQEENGKLAALIEQLQLKSVKEEQRNGDKVGKMGKIEQRNGDKVGKVEQRNGDKVGKVEEEEQKRKWMREKEELEQKIQGLSVKLNTCETKLKIVEEVNKSQMQKPVVKSGSYEEALLEEMDKMKRGFEKKIHMLSEELTSKQKQIRKKEGQTKQELEKLKWQKSLLLKKFQSLVVK